MTTMFSASNHLGDNNSTAKSNSKKNSAREPTLADVWARLDSGFAHLHSLFTDDSKISRIVTKMYRDISEINEELQRRGSGHPSPTGATTPTHQGMKPPNNLPKTDKPTSRVSVTKPIEAEGTHAYEARTFDREMESVVPMEVVTRLNVPHSFAAEWKSDDSSDSVQLEEVHVTSVDERCDSRTITQVALTTDVSGAERMVTNCASHDSTDRAVDCSKITAMDSHTPSGPAPYLSEGISDADQTSMHQEEDQQNLVVSSITSTCRPLDTGPFDSPSVPDTLLFGANKPDTGSLDSGEIFTGDNLQTDHQVECLSATLGDHLTLVSLTVQRSLTSCCLAQLSLVAVGKYPHMTIYKQILLTAN